MHHHYSLNEAVSGQRPLLFFLSYLKSRIHPCTSGEIVWLCMIARSYLTREKIPPNQKTFVLIFWIKSEALVVYFMKLISSLTKCCFPAVLHYGIQQIQTYVIYDQLLIRGFLIKISSRRPILKIEEKLIYKPSKLQCI